jgi:PAS domain S-box-containing protein
MDFFVVATAIILAIAVYRQRPSSSRRGSARAANLFVAGLLLLGIFYLIDLATLYGLALIIGNERATALSNTWHLKAEWVVIATSLPLICVGFVLDINARRRAESALEASEARYRSVVQDQLDMIVRWKGDGILTWVNDPYCREFRLSRDEAIGTSFFPFVEDVEALRKKRDALTPESPVYTNHHRLIRPDGTVGWQEWVSRGVFDPSGDLLEIQSTGRDVTARVKTECALQESEARFKGFVETSHDWVWEANMDFRCTYSNRQSIQLLGYTPEEITQISLARLVHPDSLAKFRSRFRALHAAKKGWRQLRLKFRHRNGSIRYLESSADPVFDAHGNVVAYRGIDRDRTFETLLMRLSVALVGCRADEVDDKIEQSLEQIGQSHELDRISIWWIRKGFVHFGHGWVRDSSEEPPTRPLKVADFPVASDRILKHGRALKIASVSELPDDSSDRAFMMGLGIKSMMVMPLQHEGSVVGIAVCTTVSRERQWLADSETELRLLLDKITDARRQADNTLELIRSEKDLSQSEELARVGSYAFYPTHHAGAFPDGWEAHFSSVQSDLLEVPQDEASIELFIARIHKEDRARIERALQALVDNGNRFKEQFRFVNPSGRQIHIASRAELELDHSGGIARILGSCRDITDQVNREAKLVSALEEIEALRDRLEVENIQLREEIRSYTEFEQIIGDSNTLRASLNLAARAAPTDATILILGETGTGKELVAKAIHSLSSRSSKRLVSVNCTALPANLIESELFGHEKGAFTGATRRRSGRFEAADGGTLFLDEIGDLPLELQAKLLRVLEDGGFERLGGNETIRPDVRLIAATNKDLAAAVQSGEFRADLYYRINTVPIELPPLRARKEDIPMLAQHFLEKHRDRLGKSVSAISGRMIEFLLNRAWPGNVRELENYIERSLISSTGKVLTIGEQPARHDVPVQKLTTGRLTELKSVEREHILQVLSDTGWVIDGARGAAAMLGLAPSTLRSRMKKLGIARRA